MEVGMHLWKLYFFRLLSYPNPLHTTYSPAKRERKSCQKKLPNKTVYNVWDEILPSLFLRVSDFLYFTETNFCDCKRLFLLLYKGNIVFLCTTEDVLLSGIFSDDPLL